MKRTAAITILMSVAMVSGALGVLALDAPPQTLSGTGTVTINNLGPTLTGMGINDTSNWTVNLDVNAEYLFYVNVSDPNTVDDIKWVTLEMYVLGHTTDDSPLYRYRFNYTETTANDSIPAGTWTQEYPTTGTYLNVANCAVPGDYSSSTGTYIFAVTLNKTAKAGSWSFNSSVTDSSGVKSTSSTKSFSVYKYLEMTYDNGGTMNFSWVGATGATDVADPFTVTVTANTGCTLSAAYQNRFYNGTTTWANEPVLEVQQGAGIKTTLTNYTTSFASWTVIAGPIYNYTTSHTLYLDIEPILPVLTYSGVTIYIRASV